MSAGRHAIVDLNLDPPRGPLLLVQAMAGAAKGKTGQARMEKLRKGQLYGRFFAASRERLHAVAERLKVRRLVNLTGCPVA